MNTQTSLQPTQLQSRYILCMYKYKNFITTDFKPYSAQAPDLQPCLTILGAGLRSELLNFPLCVCVRVYRYIVEFR